MGLLQHCEISRSLIYSSILSDKHVVHILIGCTGRGWVVKLIYGRAKCVGEYNPAETRSRSLPLHNKRLLKLN